MKRIATDTTRLGLRTTPWGPVAVMWSICHGKPAVDRIVLSRPGALATHVVAKAVPRPTASSCTEIESLLDRIEAFLDGEAIKFSLDVVRLDTCSMFQQRVLRAEHAIPRGRVSSYRLIAKHLGDPNGARAVGMALASNPFPIVIPCHRAICSDGSLGGYQGGPKMKRALLEMEGVTFRDADHVATREFFYGS